MIDPQNIHIAYNENGVIDIKDYIFLYTNPTYIYATLSTFARLYQFNQNKLPSIDNIKHIIKLWEKGDCDETLTIIEKEFKVEFQLIYIEPKPITRHVYVLDFTTTHRETYRDIMNTLSNAIYTYKNNKKVLDINLSFDFEEKFKNTEEYENR